MKKTLSIFICMLICISCKKDFLTEKALSFYTSSNAFVTYSDFNTAVNDMYRLVRSEFYTSDQFGPFDYLYSTDLVFDGQPSSQRHTNLSNTFYPSGTIPSSHWLSLYQLIADANAIIDLSGQSQLTAAQKTLVIAKAKFFRAFGYRTLAYLFGGVPLSLNQVTAPKTNYTRATRAQVYDQCIADLKDAIAGLPAINAVVDGEVNVQAATHLLAEVYLAAGQYQNSVDAASTVINSNLVGLMTSRFGSKAKDTTGNVYWDLFQVNNQNRKSGNTEGLWVVQMETDVPGGGSLSTAMTGYLLERHHAPYVGSLISTNGNNDPFLWPADNNSGGRGIGWAISTRHFSDEIWQSDFNNDIRNANVNFVRIFTSNNPLSPYFGQKINVNNPPPGITVPSRGFYAYQAKCSPPGSHPANLIDPTTGLLKSTAGVTYTDQYMFRLAETYLIRAEAYLGLGDKTNAAADINVVRARSKASPVLAANVNIDYILDERMRELGVEEKRMLTLTRLGLVYDRVKRFNTYYNDIASKYNLWPIPAGDIEANKDASLSQNPGY